MVWEHSPGLEKIYPVLKALGSALVPNQPQATK